MKHAASDVGIQGTARYRRVWELRGLSQAKAAKLCRPATTQATISDFERGALRMNWDLAARLVPAYFPQELRANEHHAKRLIWQLWFANVAAYGDALIQRYAEELRTKVFADIYPPASDGPLFDPQQNSAIGENSRQAAEVLRATADGYNAGVAAQKAGGA